MVDQGWHLRKEVTVGNLVASAMLILVLASGWVAFDKRLTRLEEANAYMDMRVTRLEERNTRALESIREHLIRIENKLDGKVDK